MVFLLKERQSILSKEEEWHFLDYSMHLMVYDLKKVVFCLWLLTIERNLTLHYWDLVAVMFRLNLKMLHTSKSNKCTKDSSQMHQNLTQFSLQNNFQNGSYQWLNCKAISWSTERMAKPACRKLKTFWRRQMLSMKCLLLSGWNVSTLLSIWPCSASIESILSKKSKTLSMLQEVSMKASLSKIPRIKWDWVSWSEAIHQPRKISSIRPSKEAGE